MPLFWIYPVHSTVISLVILYCGLLRTGVVGLKKGLFLVWVVLTVVTVTGSEKEQRVGGPRKAYRHQRVRRFITDIKEEDAPQYEEKQVYSTFFK